MEDSESRQMAALTDEQRALLEEHGIPAPAPHRSTRIRRAAKGKSPFPVISRSGRSFREANGRRYGEVGGADQRQADAKFWRPGIAVRDALEPMTVAVDGIVERIYEVGGWTKDPDGGKWAADLGRALTSADLDRDYPGYPYRVGDPCPTRRGVAYRPEFY